MDRSRILETFQKLTSSGRTGFTLTSDGTEYSPTAGYAVGTQRFTNIDAAIEAMRPDLFLGWWRSPDGREHIDLVQIFAAKATAFVAAYCRGEMSVYDFANDDLIDCTHFYTEREITNEKK